MEEIALTRVEPDLAARLLAGCEGLDPRGLCTPADISAMTHAGLCFAATSGDSQAVYVVRVANGVAWIDAAKGFSPCDWDRKVMALVELQAKGLRQVAFQTRRRGMVRTAERAGYHVAGWILAKELHNEH